MGLPILFGLQDPYFAPGFAPIVSNTPPTQNAVPIYMSNQLIKLKPLNPFIRNSNVTTDPMEIKVGPNAFFHNDDGTWTMWVEAVQNTGYPANNGMTAFMRATAPSLQGPWTVSPAILVLAAADTTTWEYDEFSPAWVIWDAANNRLVMWCHGGNNNGPRQGGIAYSTDGKVGLTWTKEVTNPVISNGAAGAFDSQQAGGDLKWAKNPVSGLWVGFYRAQKSGGPADGTVGRVTGGYGLIPASPVKTGEVISTIPAWNAGGITSGQTFYDQNGRLHGWFPTGAVGIAYVYSDDDGITWKGLLKVAAPSGTAGAYDKVSTGDVVQGVRDGDVLWFTCGTENISDYSGTGGFPMRGQSMLITPWRVQNPIKPGRFYLNGAYTLYTGTGMLTQTSYSVMGRFKAYMTQRTVQRLIWSENAAFNKQAFLGFADGSGNGAGTINWWHRTPTAIVNIITTGTFDDGLWHTFLARRVSSGSFELYIDGTLVGSSSNNPSTDATATTKAIGNWDPTGSGLGTGNNQPFLGTLVDVGIVSGYAATAAETTAWVNTRAALGGGTIVYDSATTIGSPADRGDVAIVEGQSNITYGSTLTEGPTAADALTSAATFVNILSEGLTAADAVTSGNVYNDVLSEGLTSADLVTSTVVFANSLSEGLTGADALATQVVFVSSLTEGLTSADAYLSQATFASSLSEGPTAVDALSTTVTFPNALSEGLTAADQVVTGSVFNEAVSAALTAADLLVSVATFAPSLSEGPTAADALSSQAGFVSSLSAGLTASDAVTSTATFPNILAEGLTAADAISCTVIVSALLTESLTSSAVVTLLTTTPTGAPSWRTAFVARTIRTASVGQTNG